MADIKNMNNETVNENIDDKKEQGTNPDTPANNKEEKDGILKKTGNFFKKNGKRIGVGIGLAAAFAGGMIANKVGLPSFGKKDEPGDQTEDQQ